MSDPVAAPAVTIGPFDPGDLSGAVALSQAEGWPHRAEDWALAMTISRGVVARAGGRVVGTACATPFGDVAMLNMIIVSAAMRGQGLGRRLMQAAMALARPREYRLVATEAGMPLYRRLGFRPTGGIAQFQGVLQGVSGAVEAPAPEMAEPADAGAVAALDRAATGMDRAGLIAALLARGQVALLRRDGRIVGYGARRRFGRGLLVGPVIAPDAEAARGLMAGLFAGCAGQFTRIDIPEDDRAAGWLEGLGLAPAGGGTVMSLGPSTPPPAAPACFALAAQAFG